MFPFIDKFPQRSEPRFITPPARDGGAVDRLPRLPLTRRSHRPGVRFRAQTGVVPFKSAGRDHSPDDRLWHLGQFFVINLDETIRWQYLAPMIDKPLVASEIA